MAGLFRRFLSHFGLFKDDRQEHSPAKHASAPGFTVKLAVPRDIGPVISECTPGAGGVQGLRWYAEKLMMDEDGDVAQEFLDEIPQASSCGPQNLSNFEVKLPTGPAKLKGPLCTQNGNVHHFVDSSSG